MKDLMEFEHKTIARIPFLSTFHVWPFSNVKQCIIAMALPRPHGVMSPPFN